MALQDEIKQEHKKVKDMTIKGKLKYFWDYYKIHTIVGIIVAFGLVIFVRDIIRGNRPVYLDAIMINTILDYNDPNTIGDDFAEYANVDLDVYNLSIDSSASMALEGGDQMSMATAQKIMALFQAKSLDVLVAPEEIIDFYSSEDVFGDMNNYLSSDKIKLLKDNGFPIYYSKNEEGVTFPAGFYISESEYLKNKSEYGTYTEDANPIFAVTFCNANPESTIEFLSMLTGLELK